VGPGQVKSCVVIDLPINLGIELEKTEALF
jgi:hypothetical protein